MKKRPIRIEGDIAYVPLTKGKEAIIDAEDAEIVGQHNWRCDGWGYVMTTVRTANGKKTTRSLHRLIMNPPEGMEIDHIHGNKLDNRKAQLRIATRVENSYNRGAHVNNTSGKKGVSWHMRDKKWVAKIRHEGKAIHLGYFTTPELAHQAYCKASAELHKEFSRTA